MRNFSRIFVVLLFLSIASVVNAQKEAVIKFETETIDLGDIPRNGKKSTVFKFKNTGKSNLVINSVSASCGCTTVKFTKDVVKPGATGEIKVNFNSHGERRGKFIQHLSVVSNGNPPKINLIIKGNIVLVQRK